MALDIASDGDIARNDDDGVPTWGARFGTALRGYDRTQVDHYVEELTQRVIVLRSAVANAEAAAHEAHSETVRLSAELAETRSRLAMVQGGIPLDTGGAQRLMQLAVETAEGLRAEAAAIAATTQAEAHAALEAAQHERTRLLESAAVEKAAILDEARRTAVALAEAGRVTAEARRAEGASSRKRAEQAAKKEAQKILAAATADRTQATAARTSAAALLAAAEQAAQATEAELARSRDAIAAVHDQREAVIVASRTILADLNALAGDLASAGAEPGARSGATGLDIRATPKEDGASP